MDKRLLAFVGRDRMLLAVMVSIVVALKLLAFMIVLGGGDGGRMMTVGISMRTGMDDCGVC